MGKVSKTESSLCLSLTLSQTSATFGVVLAHLQRWGLQTSLLSPSPAPEPPFHAESLQNWEFLTSPLSEVFPHTLALLVMFAQNPPVTRSSQNRGNRGTEAKLGLNMN